MLALSHSQSVPWLVIIAILYLTQGCVWIRICARICLGEGGRNTLNLWGKIPYVFITIDKSSTKSLNQTKPTFLSSFGLERARKIAWTKCCKWKWNQQVGSKDPTPTNLSISITIATGTETMTTQPERPWPPNLCWATSEATGTWWLGIIWFLTISFHAFRVVYSSKWHRVASDPPPIFHWLF